MERVKWEEVKIDEIRGAIKRLGKKKLQEKMKFQAKHGKMERI